MKINVHQLGVSHSKKIRLQICRYLHIDGRICFELSTFLDSPRMRRWVSFNGPLRSEAEFRHHLPVVLGIHNLPFGMCIWRTAGRCCRNSVSDRSGSWKLTASMHPRAVQKCGQFETDTTINMQISAYFQPYLFRTGDA